MIDRKKSSRRTKKVYIFFVIAFLLSISRAFVVQIFPSFENSLKHIADRQYQSVINLSSVRGTIYDRRNMPLSLSVKTPSIAINPRVFSPTPNEAIKICKILNLTEKQLQNLSSKPKYFAWLKRKVSHRKAEEIKALKIEGVHYVLEPSRYYPGNYDASSLLGYVGTDNVGLLGLERSFDRVLRGSKTKQSSLRDARGQQIFVDAELVTPVTAGHNIILTLDRVVQGITETALSNGMKASGAKMGYAIVMDPHTGRILAMANSPGFNPNSSGDLNLDNTANSAVSYRFEPGSIMKPFVIAEAIEKKLTNSYEIHHCERNGRFKVGRNQYIHDDHPKEFRTTEEILVHSSNICTFKIAARLGQEGLYTALKNFGFSSSRDFDFPGASRGYIPAWKDWREIRFANLSFGQGLLVTGLEVVRAYAALANGGHLVEPYVIQRIETSDGEIIEDYHPQVINRPISSETSRIVSKILTNVVRKGTASRAKTDLYSTAGKTGTAEKVDPKIKSYSRDKRIANFAGFSPTTDPHLIVYVVLDEPSERPAYGGLWAAPVFSEIVKKTLLYLNVAPDLSSAPRLSS